MLSLERAPSFVASRWTTELREKLFECYINFSIFMRVREETA